MADWMCVVPLMEGRVVNEDDYVAEMARAIRGAVDILLVPLCLITTEYARPLSVLHRLNPIYFQAAHSYMRWQMVDPPTVHMVLGLTNDTTRDMIRDFIQRDLLAEVELAENWRFQPRLSCWFRAFIRVSERCRYTAATYRFFSRSDEQYESDNPPFFSPDVVYELLDWPILTPTKLEPLPKSSSRPRNMVLTLPNGLCRLDNGPLFQIQRLGDHHLFFHRRQ
jgi:hypothetical protein